jgi:hypothetical protein
MLTEAWCSNCSLFCWNGNALFFKHGVHLKSTMTMAMSNAAAAIAAMRIPHHGNPPAGLAQPYVKSRDIDLVPSTS